MLSTSFLNQVGRKITTSNPIVLVIGIGPTLKIMKTIKTIAHLILAQLGVVE
jgi:hypothetical protein